MEIKRNYELNDDDLENVAGGLYDFSWAEGRIRIGDTIDLSRYLPNGCRFCKTYPVITTVTGISGYAHACCCECTECGLDYHYNVDTDTIA